ncbi:MAG: HAMP domain-containing protein [Alphaproteobacteria bacterium]|nr:HAMP domain-containing protein [Alphaproteobacteria bacterium]
MGTILLLGAVQLADSAHRSHDAWRTYQAAAHAERLTEAFHTLMGGQEALAFESARTRIVLQNPMPINAMNRTFLDDNRALIETTCDKVKDPAWASYQENLAMSVEEMYADLKALRTRVDADLALPKASRDPALPMEWEKVSARLNGVLEARLFALLERELSRDNSDLRTISQLLTMRFNGSQLRLSGVAESSRIHMAVRMDNPIPMEALREVAANRGRSEALWMVVEQQAMSLNMPELGQGLLALDRQLHVALRPLQDKVLEKAAEGGYGISEKQYLSVAMPTFMALQKLMNTVTDVSNRLADEHKAASLRMVALNVAVIGGYLALIVVALWFVSRRLVRPLEQMSDVLRRLRKGEYEVSLPWSRRGDEIGNLSEGMEAFRANLIEREHVLEESRIAKAEAERANLAKSQFLSSMSHELRTPLNSIMGFAQLLKLDDLTPEQVKSVDTIMAGGEHLLELINEVLELAKIEAGRLTINREDIDGNAVFRETGLFIQGMADKRAITVHNLPDGDLAANLVNVDRTRLRQVFLNLLSNAVKYNREKGDVYLTVETRGDRVRFNVRDTGLGIPDDDREKVFEPFNRLGAEQTETEGTGIGMTVTKQLVEAMDGVIDFVSVAGQGSTFWIEFPAVARA